MKKDVSCQLPVVFVARLVPFIVSDELPDDKQLTTDN